MIKLLFCVSITVAVFVLLFGSGAVVGSNEVANYRLEIIITNVNNTKKTSPSSLTVQYTAKEQRLVLQ